MLTFKNVTMENKNKEGDKDILEGEDNVKFCTVRPTKSFGHAERIQNQRIPKQPAKKKKKRNATQIIERRV